MAPRNSDGWSRSSGSSISRYSVLNGRQKWDANYCQSLWLHRGDRSQFGPLQWHLRYFTHLSLTGSPSAVSQSQEMKTLAALCCNAAEKWVRCWMVVGRDPLKPTASLYSLFLRLHHSNLLLFLHWKTQGDRFVPSCMNVSLSKPHSYFCLICECLYFYVGPPASLLWILPPCFIFRRLTSSNSH